MTAARDAESRSVRSARPAGTGGGSVAVRPGGSHTPSSCAPCAAVTAFERTIVRSARSVHHAASWSVKWFSGQTRTVNPRASAIAPIATTPSRKSRFIRPSS